MSDITIDELPAAAEAPARADQRLTAGIGDNGGPTLDEAEADPDTLSWRSWVWRRAYKKAWKTPPREIALRRLERAEALGMTYQEYTLEILERGRYL